MCDNVSPLHEAAAFGTEFFPLGKNEVNKKTSSIYSKLAVFVKRLLGEGFSFFITF